MKLPIKILLMLIVIIVGPMFMKDPSGKPIMTIEDWIPRDMLSFIGNSVSDISVAVEDGTKMAKGEPVLGEGAQVYTWRDENGALHYSDVPVEGAESITLSEDTLAIPSQHFISRPTGVDLKDIEAGLQARSGGRASLIEDRDRLGSTGGSGSPAAELEHQLKALTDGDLSKIQELLKQQKKQ